jgi:hypothetical protein
MTIAFPEFATTSAAFCRRDAEALELPPHPWH